MCSFHRTPIAGTAARAKSPSSRLALVLASLCIACPSIASAYNFTLGAYGPNRVVQGHDFYFEATSTITDTSGITDGTARAFAFYYVDGLPAGATLNFPSIDVTCCVGNRNWSPQNTLVKISVPSTVPTGSYALTLRVVSNGITQQIPYTMAVDPVPGPLPTTVISSIPAIPDLALWQSQMISNGLTYCNQSTISSQIGWEGGEWYYDGTRVFYQIADYTGDSSWLKCAGYVETAYTQYVSSVQTPGWRVFPHGVYQYYLRNNQDANAAAAINLLAATSAFAASAGAIDTSVNGYQRETAYIANAYRIAGYLGKPNPTMYTRSVDFLLGMIDQMFVSKTQPFLKPFMTGLMMEALIQYYNDSGDPRVPPAIKAAADGMWARALWALQNPQTPCPGGTGNTFYYESSDTPLIASPDLNLLIAPAYAWLYNITGNPVYQQEADSLFQCGVETAFLGQGKQFNQNYRWSFDYVNWRLHPYIPAPAAPASLTVTPSTSLTQ